MNRKLVYIEWIDAETPSISWTHLADIEDRNKDTLKVFIVGWVVKETEDAIHIAPHFGIEPDQVVGSICIPKCSILKNVPIDLE